MSKGYVKRSVSKKPASKPNYRTLKGLAAAVVLGAAAYGLFHYAKSNPSSSAYVANEVSSRQHFLEDIAKDLPIPYMSSITYDPTGELLYNTQLTLAQKVHPDISRNDLIVHEGFSTKNINGMYEASTPEVLDTAGKGEKSPIFFGKKLFVDPAFKSFTKDDYKLIIMHEHRHARQHALGYDGVDMPELIKNFRNGSIDSKVFWAASELDANAEELRLIRTGYPASAALLDNLFENICMDLTPSTPGFVMSSVSRQFYETVLSNNRPILNVYASEIAQKRIELEKKRKK